MTFKLMYIYDLSKKNSMYMYNHNFVLEATMVKIDYGCHVIGLLTLKEVLAKSPSFSLNLYVPSFSF